MGIGTGVGGLRSGEGVAGGGANRGVEASVVVVTYRLVVKLPDEVDFESAAFTTVAAIALHGFRLAEAALGETVAVIGRGLVGLIAVQIARAAGCRVIGFDPQEERARRAVGYGAEDAAATEEEFAAACATRTNGRGADVVLIAADTKSNAPVALAGRIARDRAVVVSIGAVGTEIPRKEYFEKELEFRISRSYGPGRYDASYEIDGHDYPIGFVRWTENRNLAAGARLLAAEKIAVPP